MRRVFFLLAAALLVAGSLGAQDKHCGKCLQPFYGWLENGIGFHNSLVFICGEMKRESDTVHLPNVP